MFRALAYHGVWRGSLEEFMNRSFISIWGDKLWLEKQKNAESKANKS